jgi:hypothetical protein
MGGGGSYNPNIVSCLRDQLPHTRFALIDEIGIPEETLGFSLLGLEGFVGRLMIVPKNVESDKTGVIRHIQPGKNMRKTWKHVCKVRRRRSVKRRNSFCSLDPVLGRSSENEI